MALVAPQVSSSREPQASSQGHLQQQEDARSDSIESSFTGGKDAPAPEVDLLSVSFNQDSSCFACATNSGFRIFCCDPLKETIRREFNGGGIGLVEMLFRCNFLALVGGGENPRYPPNKVMIWDDNQSRCIGELTFRSEVRAVRLRRDRIVVVLEHKVYVYNFEDLKLLHTVETLANTKGLCVISQATNNAVMACPGIHKGQVRVDLFDSKRTRFITAHDSALACLALTLDGKRLATASVKGTLLRIWNTADGTKLQEVRRGADRAEIYSIAFSSAAHFLALCSDKGTVHVFALKPSCVVDADPMDYASLDGKKDGSSNSSSSLSFMKGVLPKYFSSEWSFAQSHLPEETKAIVAFGAQKHTLVVVAADGRFYMMQFDPTKTGEMERTKCMRFLDEDLDS